MKFSDILNEGDWKDYDKLSRKVKLMYKALRIGSVNISKLIPIFHLPFWTGFDWIEDDVTITYELPTEYYLIPGGIDSSNKIVIRDITINCEKYPALADDIDIRQDLLRYISRRIKKYLYSILIAVRVWFVVGILVGIAPDFAKPLGIIGTIEPGKGIMFTYIGIAFGDFLSGSLSQLFKTRKKIVFIFLTFTFAGILFFLFSNGLSATQFYILCVYFGIATGYWVVFVTMAAEQFGTNLRATVTTTVPNMVRGSLILVTLAFTSLKAHYGLVNAAIMVGTGTVCIAYWALWHLEETFGKDLDYIEESGEIGL